jgi:hypothetical protein
MQCQFNLAVDEFSGGAGLPATPFYSLVGVVPTTLTRPKKSLQIN